MNTRSEMMQPRQRRNFLHWMFFQEPRRKPHANHVHEDEYENQSAPPPKEDASPTIDIPIPLPFAGPARPKSAAPTQKKWVRLEILSDGIRENIELNDFPIEIGSASSSIIRLSDTSISPRHAVLDLHNGTLTVTDTHSQNGVSVGNTWLTAGIPYPVKPGDTLLIGRTRITIEAFAGLKEQDKDYYHNGNRDFIFNINEADFMRKPMPQNWDSFLDVPLSASQPQVAVKTTLEKILDESDVMLFRDVLGLPEAPRPPKPPKSPQADPPAKNEQTTAMQAGLDETITNSLENEVASVGVVDIDGAEVDEASVGVVDIDGADIDEASVGVSGVNETDIDENVGVLGINNADISVTNVGVSDINEASVSMSDIDETNIDETDINEAGNDGAVVDEAVNGQTVWETSSEQARTGQITIEQSNVEQIDIMHVNAGQTVPMQVDIDTADISNIGAVESETEPVSQHVRPLSSDDILGGIPQSTSFVDGEDSHAYDVDTDFLIDDDSLTAEEFIEALIDKSNRKPRERVEHPANDGLQKDGSNIAFVKKDTMTAKTICPKCNAASANGSKFCGSCGTSLAGATLKVDENEAGKKAKCGKCGTENSSNSKFCGKCGNMIDGR